MINLIAADQYCFARKKFFVGTTVRNAVVIVQNNKQIDCGKYFSKPLAGFSGLKMPPVQQNAGFVLDKNWPTRRCIPEL